MYLEPNDRMRTVIDKPYSTKGDHAKAYANLELWGRQGKLQPIDGWDGDLVAGYADILGLKP